MSIGMVTVLQRKEDLHKVVPDSFLRYGSASPLRRLDDGRQVAATTELHENIQYTLVAVDMAVMVPYDVIMMQVFQNITVQVVRRARAQPQLQATHTSATICLRSRSVMRSKLSSLRAKI